MPDKPINPCAKMFTVISLLDSTGEVIADHIAATDPHEAMRAIADKTEHGGSDQQIICAIPGEHQATCPCEDAGKAAWASDLQTDEVVEAMKAGDDTDGPDFLLEVADDKPF